MKNLKVGPHFYDIVVDDNAPAVCVDHSKRIIQLPKLEKEMSRYSAVWMAALTCAREVYGVDRIATSASDLANIIVQLLQENNGLRWREN